MLDFVEVLLSDTANLTVSLTDVFVRDHGEFIVFQPGTSQAIRFLSSVDFGWGLNGCLVLSLTQVESMFDLMDKVGLTCLIL